MVVFFDEMESIFRTRGSGVSSDMETTVVPQLLTELDGVEGLDNVIVIGATNREELIDPAILRPGRLDVKIRVHRPDRAGSRDIFARYITDELPLAEPGASPEGVDGIVVGFIGVGIHKGLSLIPHAVGIGVGKGLARIRIVGRRPRRGSSR